MRSCCNNLGEFKYYSPFEIDTEQISPIILPVIIPKVPDMPVREPGATFLPIITEPERKDTNLVKIIKYGGLLALGYIILQALSEKPKKVSLSGIASKRYPGAAWGDPGGAMRGNFPCVDTRRLSISRVVPRLTSERRKLLSRNKKAFLLPGGTPHRGDIPSYPIVNRKGCFHCGIARAAYTRIGTQLNRRNPGTYKEILRDARKNLISMALVYADPKDKNNACNWSLRASRRFK